MLTITMALSKKLTAMVPGWVGGVSHGQPKWESNAGYRGTIAHARVLHDRTTPLGDDS